MYKCSLRDVIKAVPGIQTVALPDDWFDQLDDSVSVFENLYRWMINSRRIPADCYDDVHNRTYVGQGLMKKFLAAEKKRLRKVHKLTGEKLERQLSWISGGVSFPVKLTVRT